MNHPDEDAKGYMEARDGCATNGSLKTLRCGLPQKTG